MIGMLVVGSILEIGAGQGGTQGRRRAACSNNMGQIAQKYHSKLKDYVTDGPGEW